MNIERRFAIVIGINDYDEKPLDCSVNDAKAVAGILESRCKFNVSDIHLITSETSKPVKDITGHFDQAIKAIQSEITQHTDSIFFFFAGHGKYQFDNSGLKFQDSYMQIADIFNSINEMQPKYQCYVIDACESGGKVLTRGEENESDFVKKFIAQSTGTLFMYAASENEKAKEYSSLGHGLFTNYFLEAINNESLYDEGILTPNRIQDHIAKRTLKESNFRQTPVIENRTIGYYPFAFNSDYTEPSTIIPDAGTLNSNEPRDPESESDDTIREQYFPEVPREIRVKMFDLITPRFKDVISQWLASFNSEGYEITESDDFGIFSSEVEDKLKDSIVNKSVSEKVVSIEGIFSSEREIIKPDPILALGSIVEAMLRKSEPEYRYFNYINWSSNSLLCKSVFFRSDDIRKVSFGFSIIVYQAIYGIGLAELSFYLDYNGFINDKLKGPFTSIKPFKVNAQTVDNIENRILYSLKFLEGQAIDWNKKRIKSIDDFHAKSK